MRSIKMILAAVAMGLSHASFAGVNVDINTAGADEMAKSLKGVGLSKAQAIVDYRTQHGPFKTVDELAQVKGIGVKLVDANRNVIQLGAPAAKANATK